MGYQFSRKTVVYEAGEHTVRVVVREAGRLQGLRRLNLVQEAVAWLQAQGYALEDNIESVAKIPSDVWQLFLVARFERSACLAAAEELDSIPDEWLTIEGFANEMPEMLAIEWANAAYELNDHWERAYRYGEEPEGEEEKKDD